MKRYAKETHLQAALAKVPDCVLHFGAMVEQHFARILEHGFDMELLRTLPGPAAALVAPGQHVAAPTPKRRRRA